MLIIYHQKIIKQNKLKENIPIDLKKNWTPILKKTNTENINNAKVFIII